MIRYALVFAAFLSANGALAQPSPSPQPQTPTVEPRREATPEQRERFRADLTACRNEIRARDLGRGERREAVRTCMEGRNAEYRPFFARVEARRADMRACRDEVRAKDLRRTERREAFIACMEARSPGSGAVLAQRGQNRDALRDARRTCRDLVEPKNLRGDARRDAMRSCMVEKRPELKKAFTCMEEARSKGLSPGRERREFMRTCLAAG